MKDIEKCILDLKKAILQIIVDCSRDGWKGTKTTQMVLCRSPLDIYQELELLKRLGPTLPESHPAILSEELQVLQREITVIT